MHLRRPPSQRTVPLSCCACASLLPCGTRRARGADPRAAAARTPCRASARHVPRIARDDPVGAMGDEGEGGGGGAPALPARVDTALHGTGLVEAVVAAAAAAAGKSVLHADAEGRYGGAWATLSLDEAHEMHQRCERAGGGGAYEAVRVASHEGGSGELRASREYLIDACGPVALLSAGAAVEALVASGAHQYLDFKASSGTYMLSASARSLRRVPGGRADVFEDTALSVGEKRALMRLLTGAQKAAQAEPGAALKFCGADSLESATFADALAKNGVGGEVADMVTYAVAGLDSPDVSAASALEALVRYTQSVGRFGPGQGAFLVPRYGASELPQAFCRAAAVHGAIYMLRTGVELVGSAEVDGAAATVIKLSSGESIECSALVLDARSAHDVAGEGCLPLVDCTSGVARLAVVLSGSLVEAPAEGDASTVGGEADVIVAVVPPEFPGIGNKAAVRCLQVGSSTAQCPAGQCILYLATEVDSTDADCADALLRTTLEVMIAANQSSAPPSALWSMFTFQRSLARTDGTDVRGQAGVGALVPGAAPDASIGCESALAAALSSWGRVASAVGMGADGKGGDGTRELFPADEQGGDDSDEDDLALLSSAALGDDEL